MTSIGENEIGELKPESVAFALEAADELEARAKHATGMLSAIPAIVAEERIEQHNAVYEAEAQRWNRLAAAVRECAEAADKLESLSERICALDWLGNNTRLSLEHYSPVYCDDPDQRVEWRVICQSGSINDREYHCVGRGETPLAALKDAMAHDLALAHREGITPQEKDGDD
jgi:hypothetical protein